MNQRQWIPMEESTTPKRRVILGLSSIVVVATTVVFSVIGMLVGYPIPAAVLGVVLSVVYMRILMRSASGKVLAELETRAISMSDHTRIVNVVDGLCVVSGDQRPTLRVMDSAFPIAMAVAAPDAAGTVIVSTTFCETMDRVEVEAVMAHLLWRIRTGEIALTTFLLAFVRTFSRVGLGAVARGLASKSHDQRVALWADIAACQATRYPPAVVSALEKSNTVESVPVDSWTSPLWFASPEAGRGEPSEAGRLSNVDSAYPSLSERITLLKEI